MHTFDHWLHKSSDRIHKSNWKDLIIGALVAAILGIALAMTSELTKPIFFN
ncbi:MAG: hypothetical protein HQL69_00840 [Magnetococcales bacterium]|nr:hypothetical protein [Magnetococcales bacterium]